MAAVRETFSITIKTNQPLPLCMYQNISWLGTPTTYKIFAETFARIYKTQVVVDIHFKETIPFVVQEFKEPKDFLNTEEDSNNNNVNANDYNAANGLLQQEKVNCMIVSLEKPIMFKQGLSKEESSFAIDCGKSYEFPTVTDLTQVLYDVNDKVTQEENLSKPERELLKAVRDRVDAYFPGLKK